MGSLPQNIKVLGRGTTVSKMLVEVSQRYAKMDAYPHANIHTRTRLTIKKLQFSLWPQNIFVYLNQSRNFTKIFTLLQSITKIFLRYNGFLILKH